MKRRCSILLALAFMVAIAAVGQQSRDKTLIQMQWARKAKNNPPPVAVLLQLGLRDVQPKSWSGNAQVAGANVVDRKGYFFRQGEKLVEPDGWIASSHRSPLFPKGRPDLAAIEGIEPVGVILHLQNIQPDATITLTVKDQGIDKEKIPLAGVLAGKPYAIQNGRAVVRLVSTTSPVVTDKTEDDFPAAAYGPDGTLWLAYISYHVVEDSRRIEAPALKEQPKNFKAFYTPEFRDQLFVKSFRNGVWSKPIALTRANEDLMRCAVSVDRSGTAWVAYSAHRNGKFNVFSRSVRLGDDSTVTLGDEEQVTRGEFPTLTPKMCNLADGSVLLVCQQWDGRKPANGVVYIRKQKRWQEARSLRGTATGQNKWHLCPAAAPGSDQVAIAYDVYSQGDYDVLVEMTGENGSRVETIASSSQFEARPSAAFDPQGRLWIAYEVGPKLWGKDYGALDDQDGNPLYSSRAIAVACLQDGKLYQPVAKLPPLSQRPAKAPPSAGLLERIPRYSYPQIGVDGKGRLWLTYRQKFGSRYSSRPGSYWKTFARMLVGDAWSEPIEIYHSDGLLDHRPVLLPHPAGGLAVIHNTDRRVTDFNGVNNDIFYSYVNIPGEATPPKLVPCAPGAKDEKLVARAKAEAQAVQRHRDYRVRVGGKSYQLLRGEFHRHTEISWDGGPDGSLEDMFRYAIDAAALDWIGNGDHDNGAGREYPWWLTQKLTDAYHLANRFVPMFSYERSVSYPHGHRNCVFARRGVRTLPRLAQPDKKKQVARIHADDTKMLYRYLHELDGVCAVHTSATGMGTDWRDNDPIVEPIVEIYQGDRMSYEMQGAPRAGYDPKSGKKPANIAGWYPRGFIDLALKKGYRLGFQSSSDHISTHISYCIVLAENSTREAILDGLKKRHVFGATDNIILDVTSGTHLMGDEFESDAPPSLNIKVIGTSELARIDILRDSQVVHTFQPDRSDFQAIWTDPAPENGTHYYYVRVQQKDEELAWSSPMWIKHSK